MHHTLVLVLALWVCGGLFLGLPVAATVALVGVAVSPGLLVLVLLSLLVWAVTSLWSLVIYIRSCKYHSRINWRRDLIIWITVTIMTLVIATAASKTNLVTRMLEPDYTPDMAQSLLRTATDPADLVQYLQRYPTGKYVPLTLHRMVEIEPDYWKSALADPQPMKWELYLRAYPNGPHRVEAERLLALHKASVSQ